MDAQAILVALALCVSPDRSLQDLVHQRQGDAVLSCKILAGDNKWAVGSPDRLDLLGREFGAPVSLPTRNAIWLSARAVAVVSRVSSFDVPIGVVVTARSSEEVIGPDTGRLVAAVKNAQALWDGTDAQFVGDLMGRPVASICPEATVASMRDRGAPQPASIRLFNVTPEAISEVLSGREALALLRTEAADACVDLVAPRQKYAPARLALSLDVPASFKHVHSLAGEHDER